MGRRVTRVRLLLMLVIIIIIIIILRSHSRSVPAAPTFVGALDFLTRCRQIL